MVIIDGTFGGGCLTGLNTGDSEVSYFAARNGSNVTNPAVSRRPVDLSRRDRGYLSAHVGRQLFDSFVIQ